MTAAEYQTWKSKNNTTSARRTTSAKGGEMRTITAAVIKGGTGKTTLTAALAQAGAAAGKRILAIDLDPQANLTFILGADQSAAGSYQLLNGAQAAELIQETKQGISVISASPDLATEKTKAGSARRLRETLEPLKKKFDFAFIDTPPQMGELTFNALYAATGLLIPLETDNSSLQGLYQVTDIARQIQQSNAKLRILGAIIARYDPRAKLNRYFKETIEKTCEEQKIPFLPAIRSGIAIREAQALQESLFKYAPTSKPAQDYQKLFEIIKES
jgi:chromosome partitioning protein